MENKDENDILGRAEDTIRHADLLNLSFILRSEANALKYGAPFCWSYSDKKAESSLRNIKPVDCDVLYRFMILIADNLQDKATNGGIKNETYDSGL